MMEAVLSNGFETVMLSRGQAYLARSFVGKRAISITGFRIGSKSGFQILASDVDATDFVYAGTSERISYRVINSRQVEFTIELDASIGNFSIGNFVILMDSGVALCKSVHDTQFYKSKNTTVDGQEIIGNTLTLQCVAEFVVDATLVNFNITQSKYAQLPVLVNESSLPVDPSNAAFAQYVLANHTASDTPALALRHSITNKWHGMPFFQRMDHHQFGMIAGGETGDKYKIFRNKIVDGGRFNATPTGKTVDGGSFNSSPNAPGYDGGSFV